MKPKHGPVRYSGLRRLKELGFRERSCLVEVWITRSGSLYEGKKKSPLIDILSGLGFGFLWFFVDKMSIKYGFPTGYGFPTVSCGSPKSRKNVDVLLG